jgi:predicted amidohydrolase YtcJ
MTGASRTLWPKLVLQHLERIMIRSLTLAGLASLTLATTAQVTAAQVTAARATTPLPPADLVVTHARIYTAAPDRHMAQAMALRAGKIVLVGTEAEVRGAIGSKTKVLDAKGRLVLPGLVDAHIHPPGIAEIEGCSFESHNISLEAMGPFIRGCIQRFNIPKGEWVAVALWNFAGGNEPSDKVPTLRAALDLASTDHPIVLLGNDGHHAAFNSVALARAKTAAGKVVGLSRATLASDFQADIQLVGVDKFGEPSGAVNEEAGETMDPPGLITANLPALMKEPELVTQRLNSVGITAVQDAWVTPQTVPLYDALLQHGTLTVRVNLMQLFEPEAFRRADGVIDYPALITEAKALRAKYAGQELIRAEALKIFADGVMEGNPYANPPTLPNSPSLTPYLQPIFGKDAKGELTVKGYVDLQSSSCIAARSDPKAFEGVETAFEQTNGFLPSQCQISYGKPQHARQVMLDYARAAHMAGFTLHIHAISDAAVRTSVDAIEAARAADGNSATPDTLAHTQLIAPEEVARIGKDHLFMAYTYNWMNALPEYDINVVPFHEKVIGNSFEAFHKPDSYYERQFYPAKSTKEAGAILAAGSDAPVGLRDPEPFVNMEFGVTRTQPGFPPANPQERLTIRDLIDAYTLNGARAMGRSAEFGSLEPGKSADFIIVDQDILALGDTGHASDIGKTKVLETWFRGVKVYSGK